MHTNFKHSLLLLTVITCACTVLEGFVVQPGFGNLRRFDDGVGKLMNFKRGDDRTGLGHRLARTLHMKQNRVEWDSSDRHRSAGRTPGRKQVSFMSRSLSEALMEPSKQQFRTGREPVQPREEIPDLLIPESPVKKMKKPSFATKVLDFLTMKNERLARDARVAEQERKAAEEEAAALKQEAETKRLLQLLGSYAERHDNSTAISVMRMTNSSKKPIPSRFAEFGKELEAASRSLAYNTTTNKREPSPEPSVSMHRSIAARESSKASQPTQSSRLEQLMASYQGRYSSDSGLVRRNGEPRPPRAERAGGEQAVEPPDATVASFREEPLAERPGVSKAEPLVVVSAAASKVGVPDADDEVDTPRVAASSIRNITVRASIVLARKPIEED